MKKLMVMLSAAALAFGLHAGTDTGFISGTAFEAEDGGNSWNATAGFATGYWEGYGAETTTVTAVSHSTSEADRPAKFKGCDDENVLAIKTTFGNPVKLNVKSTGEGQPIADGGLYFDGLVNMTVCDFGETPVIADENAKLAVYLQAADAEETTTKLVIKAGCIGGDAKAYDCPGLTEGWHRLTIKAIKNIYTEASGSSQLGFVVFVDGNAVGSTDNDRGIVEANLTPAAAEFYTGKKLFPSMVNGEDLTYIGFDGQGKVDELVFTSKAPDFAKDSDFFTLSWQAGVTGFTCGDITKSDLTEAGSVPVKITLTDDEPSYTVNVTDITYAEDKVGDPTTNFTATAENLAGTITAGAAEANFNGKGYATVAKAIEAANGIEEAGNYTLKLFAGAEAVSIGNATAGVNLTLDLAGQTITDSADADAITVSVGSLRIIDSSNLQTGTVNVPNEGYAVSVADGATVAIEAGIYNGTVSIEGAGSTIAGGQFLISANESINATVIPEGKALVKDEDETYWIVGDAPKGWAIYLTQGEKENEFLIQDEGDLLDLATNLNKTADFATTGITFKQTEDIDLAGIAWSGIGVYVEENSPDNNMFCGIYDGNEKEVQNITFAKKEYNGLFGNLGGEAQIKDLTITVAGFADGDATSYGFGAAAGYAMGTDVLLENITVNPAVDGQDSICGAHNMGGIGARLAGKITLKDCTNNLDISTTYSKIGGMCAIASQRDAVGAIEFNGCVNNGEITGVGLQKANTEAGSDGCAGILGYIQDGSSTNPKAGNKPVSFINCVNNGTLQHTGETGTTKACIASILGKAGGQVYQTVDGNSAKADYLSVASGTAPDGLKFATVNGGVATFGATPALDGNYKVMAAGAAYEFTEVGSITFDNSLVPTFAPTTDTTKFTLTNEGYVWTCAEKPAGPTSDEGAIGDADPKTGIAQFTPTDPTAKEVTVELNGFTGRVSFPGTIETIKGVPANQIIVLNSEGHSIDASAFVGGDDKGYSTALTAAAQKPAFATTTEGETAEKPFVVGDETVAVGVQTINGLIYQLQAEAALDNSWTAAGNAVEGNGQPMTFSTEKTDAPAQFYSIKVSK